VGRTGGLAALAAGACEFAVLDEATFDNGSFDGRVNRFASRPQNTISNRPITAMPIFISRAIIGLLLEAIELIQRSWWNSENSDLQWVIVGVLTNSATQN
jgi:hypothetical protein